MLRNVIQKVFSAEFVRFTLIGVINTVATYLLFVLLATFTHYLIAYTVGYIVGIVISYVLNARFAFRTAMHWKSMLAYPLVYLIQYVVGLLLLPFLIDTLKIDRVIAAPIVVVVTLPISFFASRVIIKQGGNSTPPA